MYYTQKRRIKKKKTGDEAMETLIGDDEIPKTKDVKMRLDIINGHKADGSDDSINHRAIKTEIFRRTRFSNYYSKLDRVKFVLDGSWKLNAQKNPFRSEEPICNFYGNIVVSTIISCGAS